MKQIYILLLITPLLVLFSCKNNTQKTSDEIADSIAAALVTDSLSQKINSVTISFPEIISLLNEKTGPFTYDQGYFDDYDSIQKSFENSVQVACIQSCKKLLPDSIFCEDSLYFMWKISATNFTLLDFAIKVMLPQGTNVLHNLITVDKNGKIIDCKTEWAGLYFISVENPEGVMSSGNKYKTGKADYNPTVFFSSDNPDKTTDFFELSSDGHFVEHSPGFVDQDLK